jgi:bifunctional DNA-binding transcriptional regulator/antitoxin component of YhaV-PrlF toxin-antitoxin module
MSETIKLTSKRQATFPARLCEQMGLKPGDEIELIPKVKNGEQFWILQKHASPSRPWFSSLRAYAENAEDHSLDAIRESIAHGRKPSS